MTKAYMQSHHKVLLTQYEAMRDLCQDFSEGTYKLFCHILVCTLLRLNKGEKEQYSPVSYNLIKKSALGASWRELSDRWLIEDTDYSRSAGLSKEYKVTDLVLDMFFKLQNIPDYRSAVKVNLFSGKVTKAICKSNYKDDTGHLHPPLIRAAMDIFEENKCVYKEQAILDHLSELEEQVLEKKARLNKGLEQKAAVDSILGRYRNDDACWRSVLDQNPEDIGDGLYKFKPAYDPTSTGRIQIQKGGLQTCTREMKRAAYSNIPDLRNYDLKASQVNIAIQLLEDANINTKWLCDYRDKPNNKYVYAELVGISVDSWKICLLAMLMGAHFPKNTKRFETRESAILKVLGEEAKGDSDEVLRLHSRLEQVVAGLNKSLDQWHEWLLHTYIPVNQKQGGQERKWYITNKAEKRMCVTDLPKTKSLEWEVKAKVAAFLLQGQEAMFIHCLTTISTQYGYKPIANEHDGLICLGEIPLKAVNEAAAFSGLRYAKLEEKPFT